MCMHTEWACAKVRMHVYMHTWRCDTNFSGAEAGSSSAHRLTYLNNLTTIIDIWTYGALELSNLWKFVPKTVFNTTACQHLAEYELGMSYLCIVGRGGRGGYNIIGNLTQQSIRGEKH